MFSRPRNMVPVALASPTRWAPPDWSTVTSILRWPSSLVTGSILVTTVGIGAPPDSRERKRWAGAAQARRVSIDAPVGHVVPAGGRAGGLRRRPVAAQVGQAQVVLPVLRGMLVGLIG